MGTSSSSTGSPSGASIVPDWTPPPPADSPAGSGAGTDPAQAAEEDGEKGGNETAPPSTAPAPVVIAPRGRFAPSRTSLGEFARGGSSTSMRRGLGHYVKKGMQGSRHAVRRFGGSAVSAGQLYGALTSVASGTASPGSLLDRTILAGRSAHEVIAAIIEAVRPTDGTQDTEAARDAMQRALANVLEQFPDADLLDLTDDQRMFVIERYLAMDVFNRAWLDVGKSIMGKAATASAAVTRMREIRDYIRETVAAAFRKLHAVGVVPSAQRVAVMAREALRETFQIFEAEAG